MKKAIIIKIFSIIMLALFIFASISVCIFYFGNSYIYKKGLLHYTDNWVERVNQMQSDDELKEILSFAHDDVIKITFYRMDGTYILGSSKDVGNVINKKHLKKFKTLDINERFLTNYTSDYYNRYVVASFTKLQLDYLDMSSPIILCVENIATYNAVILCFALPVTLLVMIVMMLSLYFYIKNVVDNALNPIVSLNKYLVKIDNGEYQYCDVTSHYREVQLLADEINTIGMKVSNNIKLLRYEKMKSNFVLENIPQGIIVVDQNQNTLLVNQSAKDIFEIKNVILGDNIGNIVKDTKLLEKIDESVTKDIDQMIEYDIEGKTYKIEFNNIKQNWIENRKSVVSVIIFTDITNESQTAKMRSEFFANASHELRSPLTSIKGYSELMSIMPDEKTREKCLAEITKNTDAMLSLVNDMLNIARMEAEMGCENSEVIDLREIADSAIENLKPMANKKNVSLTVEGQGKILADKNKIMEVFVNLIDNAVKYNVDNGFVKVKIKENGKTVNVTIADNGIGIDKAHHHRIFERFYRVDKGRDRSVPSTGLGLFIVKKIVSLHSGKISVKSALGKGTIFELEFPSASKKEFE